MPCLACIWKIWPLRFLISLSACLEWLMHADWKWLVVRFLIFCWICSHRGMKHISYHAVFWPRVVKPHVMTWQQNVAAKHDQYYLSSWFTKSTCHNTEASESSSWSHSTMVSIPVIPWVYRWFHSYCLQYLFYLVFPFSFHFLWLACS